MSDSLRPHGLYSPWNSPGQNTGVGSLFLFQGILPTQGSNPGLPHCRQILYQLSHKGSPRLLEWVAYPFSRGTSRPRNRTRVSCIAGGFLTNWALREAHSIFMNCSISLYWSSLGLGPLFPVLCSLCRNVRLFLPVLVLSTNPCLCCSTSPLASFCLSFKIYSSGIISCQRKTLQLLHLGLAALLWIFT